MTLTKEELNGIRHYLETLLNIGYSIVEIDGKKYIPIEDLAQDLHYIRNLIIKESNEQ